MSNSPLEEYPHKSGSISGFTLIELSIVLVIIGLIIGGILVGQDLLHAAELRTILSEVDQYSTAVNTFRVKYNCLAGDCPNATDFFGVDPGCNGYNSTPVTNGTCNGDGSGEIGEYEDNEPYLAWQQLAEAGLIKGAYSGSCYDSLNRGWCSPGRQMKSGLDVPASRVMGGCYAMFGMESDMQPGFFSNTVNVSNFWSMHYGNVLMYGGDPSSMAGNNLFNYFFPVLSPQDAYSIDNKRDDGNPASGRILSGTSGTCLTAASTDNTNAAYNLATGVPNSCILIFRLDQ